MDRRNFVAGSAPPAAAALAIRPIVRRRRLSVPRHHLRQSVPAGRRRRRGRPAAHRHAGADHQAALRDRDQGRRRRPGRRAIRRHRQARRLHAADSHRVDLGLCRGRQAVRPPAEIHPRRFHSDRAADRRPDGAGGQRPAALQDAEGSGRRRQGEPRQADLLLVRPLRRAASADRAVHEGRRHQDAAPADQWRRAGADRDPRQQFAGAGVLDRRRQRPDQGRQAARARLLRRKTRPRCPTCRR